MSIQDFGEKIGGAKKDLWRQRGLFIDDLYEMNEAEKEKFIKKDNIWKKPDYEALVSEGIPVQVVYFMKLMRDSIATKPTFYYFDNEETMQEKREGYIGFVNSFRDTVMGLRTKKEVISFYDNHIVPYLENPNSRFVQLKPEAFDCITNKTLKASGTARRNFSSIEREIQKKQFCYTEDQKLLAPYTFIPYNKSTFTFKKDYLDRDMIEMKVYGGTYFFYPKGEVAIQDNWKDNTYFILKGSSIHSINYASEEDAKNTLLNTIKKNLSSRNGDVKESVDKTSKRKGKLVPRQLKHIKRIGDDYRQGVCAEGQDYLDTFSFKGGEFGNWLNDNERQSSLDFGYDAFYDLSRALEIDPQDISLGGNLSIAFGARGSGSALAHYEPLREVINLTKMKGAGSLAHEWGHALDDILGKKVGLRGFMTETSRNAAVPESLKVLVDKMKSKIVSNEETLKMQEEALNLQKKRIINRINDYFSSTLSEEAEKKKNELIDSYIKSAPESYKYFGCYSYGRGINPYVEAISNFRKECTGRVIPKEDRRELNSLQSILASRIDAIGTEVSVSTDFYKNSCIIDKNFSKSSHGYWNSTVEMFARAFACYVRDKLEEKGIKSDYLCGHSEDAIAPVSDRDGNITIIKAIPEGEERRVLNQCFDKLIAELKEKNLLHHKEYVPERAEKEKPERKESLDSLISSVKREQKEKKESVPLKLKETKNGQLSFDLFN